MRSSFRTFAPQKRFRQSSKLRWYFDGVGSVSPWYLLASDVPPYGWSTGLVIWMNEIWPIFMPANRVIGKGARVINEGGGTSSGTLFYPAVVYPVKEGMLLYREEQFGPIVPVMAFDE